MSEQLQIAVMAIVAILFFALAYWLFIHDEIRPLFFIAILITAYCVGNILLVLL